MTTTPQSQLRTYAFVPEDIQSTLHSIGVIAFLEGFEEIWKYISSRSDIVLHRTSVYFFGRG